MCVEVVHLTDVGEIVEAYRRGEITAAGAVGRLVQLGRTPRQARALLAIYEPKPRPIMQTIQEQARQEALRRSYGPRMADWFERGAYAASKGAPVAPTRRPTRAWYLNGVRWFEAQEANAP